MSLLRNYNEDDLLAKTLLLYFAFQHGSIGLFLVFEDLTILKSKTIAGMSSILPMEAWGIILLVSSASFLLSVLQENKLEYWFMLLAGTTGVITFSLLSMASMELSTNQTNTVNYMIIASIDIIVAIIGGVALWRRRTT